jgi:hypothetical protein
MALVWALDNNKTGYKIFKSTLVANAIPNNALVGKYDGKSLGKVADATSFTSADQQYISATTIYISVNIADMGITDAYSPLASEISAYLSNGWQAKTVDGTGKPTAWKSLGDGTDAPTQTLAYVSTTKAPNYTPYKLSYVLATPQISVADVEGALTVNGLTQVEVSSALVKNEKVTFNTSTKQATTSIPSRRVLQVKKGAQVVPFTTYTLNGQTLPQLKNDVDSTSEYSVTYVTDGYNYSANPTETDISFSKNIRDALDDTVIQLQDNTSQISINTKLIIDIIARMKAGGL